MQTRHIQINGASFAYRDSGQGEPMVLVHAGLSDMRSTAPLEELLRPDFRVINYSRRYSHPNPPADDSVSDTVQVHVDDLLALIESLALGKVHLVGNSVGAFVCLLAARQRPDLVRTLTLEEPPVISMFLQELPPKPTEVLKLLFSSPGALVALVRFAVGAIDPATRAFRQGNDDAAVDLFARGVLGEAAYARVSPARRQQMMDNAKAHRAMLLGSGLPVFSPADATAVTVPTQLIRGSESPAFQRRINERLASLIPAAEDVCISSASHFVHEDNPPAVAEAVRGFCGRG